jgi:YfiH family protein
MFYSKQLKKFKKIKHCFFSRKGGFSKGLYNSLNCGNGSKDDKKHISKNLNYISQIFAVKKNNLILMNQTHSNKVTEIKKNHHKKKINSDAVITKEKGLALSVVTADCVPIVIYNYNNNMIGCVHAGWKGAISGIIKNTVNKMREKNANSKIAACIGPCIGKKSYEVDLIFYKKFLKKSKKNIKYFSRKNKIKKFFDLRKFVADKLLELNVKVDHINRDTYKEATNFFSYRRSFKLNQKDYGRCISVICLI